MQAETCEKYLFLLSKRCSTISAIIIKLLHWYFRLAWLGLAWLLHFHLTSTDLTNHRTHCITDVVLFRFPSAKTTGCGFPSVRACTEGGNIQIKSLVVDFLHSELMIVDFLNSKLLGVDFLQPKPLSVVNIQSKPLSVIFLETNRLP